MFQTFTMRYESRNCILNMTCYEHLYSPILLRSIFQEWLNSKLGRTLKRQEIFIVFTEWCDGESSHQRNVKFRKQTKNKPNLWYDRSKRTNKQITDILCSMIRKKSTASRFDCMCGFWTSQVTKLKLSHVGPTKCYLKIGGKAKEREMDKRKAEMSSSKK